MAALPNMSGMMKQIQKMQEKMARIQEELEARTVVGEAGGGMVKVTANGKQHLVRMQIDREVVNPADVEMLEDLILAAVNEAGRKVDAEVQSKVGGLTGGTKIPGLT